MSSCFAHRCVRVGSVDLEVRGCSLLVGCGALVWVGLDSLMLLSSTSGARVAVAVPVVSARGDVAST